VKKDGMFKYLIFSFSGSYTTLEKSLFVISLPSDLVFKIINCSFFSLDDSRIDISNSLFNIIFSGSGNEISIINCVFKKFSISFEFIIIVINIVFFYKEIYLEEMVVYLM
jgi:hypothetical protein